MQILRPSHFTTLLAVGVAFSTSLGALAGPTYSEAKNFDGCRKAKTWLTMRAGTVFNLAATDAQGNYLPFPWFHQVRGIAQTSDLGNCKVFFDVSINAGEQGHAFRLSGKLFVTTLAGDKFESDIVGWADPDPKDPKPSPTMFKLHYDVKIIGGTGRLAGVVGAGDIDGIFMFSGPDSPEDTDETDDRFCDSYAGTATWAFEGLLILPNQRKK